MRSLAWALNLCEKREASQEDRGTDGRGRAGDSWRDIRGTVSETGKAGGGTPTGSWKRTLPRSLRGSTALPTPWSRTSRCRTVGAKFLLLWAALVRCCHSGPGTLAARSPSLEVPWPHLLPWLCTQGTWAASQPPRLSPGSGPSEGPTSPLLEAPLGAWAPGPARSIPMASPSHLSTPSRVSLQCHQGVRAGFVHPLADGLPGVPAERSPKAAVYPPPPRGIGRCSLSCLSLS